jgi:hypothetical protein
MRSGAAFAVAACSRQQEGQKRSKRKQHAKLAEARNLGCLPKVLARTQQACEVGHLLADAQKHVIH